MSNRNLFWVYVAVNICGAAALLLGSRAFAAAVTGATWDEIFLSLIIPFFILQAVSLAGVFSRRRERTRDESAERLGASLQQAERYAYEVYRKTPHIRRIQWWHWLLFMSIPTVVFAPFWLEIARGFQFSACGLGESDCFDATDPWSYVIFVVIPHIWVYPLILIYGIARTIVTKRIAKLMVTDESDGAVNGKEGVSNDSDTFENSMGDNRIPISLELLTSAPPLEIAKQSITVQNNAYGVSPKSFLYLYDFGRRDLKESLVKSLGQFGPVYWMQTPVELSALKYLRLINRSYFYRNCATSIQWVREFLAGEDTGPVQRRHNAGRYGGYPFIHFLAADVVWQRAVEYLASHVDYVVLDVRCFTSESPGLAWELQFAAANVDTQELILLADITTKMADLEKELSIGWRRRSEKHGRNDGAIRVLRFGTDPLTVRKAMKSDEGTVANMHYKCDDLVALGILR